MPIFDFACDKCGHQFEKLVMGSDTSTPSCVACHSDQVSKQVSAPAFRLGGSGWYETDFKTGKKKNLAPTSNSDTTAASSE